MSYVVFKISQNNFEVSIVISTRIVSLAKRINMMTPILSSFLYWPTRPSRIGGHYFDRWCPAIRKKLPCYNSLDGTFGLRNYHRYKHNTRLESYNDPRPRTNHSTSLKHGVTLTSVCFVRKYVTYVRTDGRKTSPEIINHFSSLCFSSCLGVDQLFLKGETK